jgi:dsRNA-specific ribonuclease
MNRTEDKLSSARLYIVRNDSLGYISYELTGMDPYLFLS